MTRHIPAIPLPRPACALALATILLAPALSADRASGSALTVWVTPTGESAMIVGDSPVNGFILEDPLARLTGQATLPPGMFQTNTTSRLASQVLDPLLQPGERFELGFAFQATNPYQIGGYDFSSLDLTYTMDGQVGVFVGQALNALAGDADLDGVVDDTDWALVQTNLGQTVSGWSEGDFSGDGRVTLFDAYLLLTEYSPPAEQAVMVPMAMMMIPEPGVGFMLIVGGAAAMLRRRPSLS